MKNLLLGTTALIGALLVTQAAQAQLSVRAGGQADFVAGFWDEDRDNANDREFKIDAEVRVRATGKAENGLMYGADIQIETSGSRAARTDEASLFIAGSWGRITLGDEDTAADAITVYAPTVGIGQIDGEVDDFIEIEPTNAFDDVFQALDDGDETKVTYLSPKFAGFQIGVSYIPELGGGTSEGDAVAVNDPTGGYSDGVVVGAAYEAEFSSIELTLSGAFARAEGNGALDNYTSWMVGVNVGFGGFTVGGSYVDHGSAVAGFSTDAIGFDEDITDFRGFNVGVAYENGPFSVAAQFARLKAEQVGNPDNELRWNYYGAGVAYDLAPGLTLGADIVHVDLDIDDEGDTDATIVLLGALFAF